MINNDKNEKEPGALEKENSVELTAEQLNDVSGGKIHFEKLHDRTNKKDTEEQSNFI